MIVSLIAEQYPDAAGTAYFLSQKKDASGYDNGSFSLSKT